METDALMLSPAILALLALNIVALSFALGLASYVGVLQGLWIATRTDAFRDLRRAWGRALIAAGALAAIAVVALALSGSLGPAVAMGAQGFPYRGSRLVVTAWLATSLVVGSISALGLWRNPQSVADCIALKMAIGMYVICGPLEFALEPGRAAAAPALGVLSLAVFALGVWGGVLTWRGAPERSRPYLAATIGMGLAGLITPLAEWLAAGPGAPA